MESCTHKYIYSDYGSVCTKCGEVCEHKHYVEGAPINSVMQSNAHRRSPSASERRAYRYLQISPYPWRFYKICGEISTFYGGVLGPEHYPDISKAALLWAKAYAKHKGNKRLEYKIHIEAVYRAKARIYNAPWQCQPKRCISAKYDCFFKHHPWNSLPDNSIFVREVRNKCIRYKDPVIRNAIRRCTSDILKRLVLYPKSDPFHIFN